MVFVSECRLGIMYLSSMKYKLICFDGLVPFRLFTAFSFYYYYAYAEIDVHDRCEKRNPMKESQGHGTEYQSTLSSRTGL
jgi:hypothetical protein